MGSTTPLQRMEAGFFKGSLLHGILNKNILVTDRSAWDSKASSKTATMMAEFLFLTVVFVRNEEIGGTHLQIEKLYPSDFLVTDATFQKSRLLLPFYASHSRGREQLLAAVKAGSAYQLVQGGRKFYLAAEETLRERLTVTNFLAAPREELLSEEEDLTWRTLLTLLEAVARRRFVRELRLTFETTESNREWLAKQGYVETARGFEKTLSYHTGIVLGGGGARGGYQIGVWQALKELEITAELITGTSVGALNGGLLLVGDVPAAKQLWLDISTDQVLQFPQAAADNTSLSLLLQQVRSLAVTALRDNGASTEPLEKLIHQALKVEKMQENPAELFVCATHLPDFNETVIHFDKTKVVEQLDWLIASASFYPAMKAKEINGEYYMDGGYRNNLPEDVALKQEATELIVVDVEGPGFVKRTPIPAGVAKVTFDSPWTLGSFLVFDQERSRVNYQLGYLETLKYFGRYAGHWYTFEQAQTAFFQKAWLAFVRRNQKADSSLWQIIKDRSFWQKLRRGLGVKVAFETAGLTLAEYGGMLLNIPPEVIYPAEAFVTELAKACRAQTEPVGAVLSVGEWLHQYRERLVAFSDTRQLLYWRRSFEAKVEVSRRLLELTPITAVAGAFLQELTATTETETSAE